MADEPSKKSGGKDGGGNKEVSLDQVVGAMKQMYGQMQELVKFQKNVETRLGEFENRLSDTSKGGKKDEPDVDDRDLETMSNKQLVAHMMGQFSKMLDEKVGSVSKEVQNVRGETEKDRLEREIRELQEKHPDFWEWRSEIRAIAEETPGISVARAYRIARSEDPDKAAELDEKYKPQADDSKDGGKGQGDGKKQQRETTSQDGSKPNGNDSGGKGGSDYGGMTPGGGSKETSATHMTFDQAAANAWDEVMAEVPDDLMGGNS